MLRFAPSPTGDMHIGNLRVAIFNYILSKQKNEKFLIRIEDTDTARNIEGKDKEILSLLNLFGLLWDDLVYQSDNFPRHRQLAEFLIKQNLAFYCYCSKEFLDNKRAEFEKNKKPFRYDESWAEIEKEKNVKPVIRLRGAVESMSFTDLIKGDIKFDKNEIESFVIIKDNAIPTYNFACAIDDMLYDISLILRGEDHVSNTPKQMLIHKNLGYDKNVKFAHLPIILSEDTGAKMSKRDQSSSVAWLLEEGFLPSAIANYLILLGNKTPTEIFNISEAIEWFDIANISHAPARFDIKKLRFINREHLKRLNESEFALLLNSKDASVGGLAKSYLQEASTLNEIREHINKIFSPKDIKATYEGATYENECRILYDVLVEMETNHSEALNDYESMKQEAMKKSNLKGKSFFKPLRILLTGTSSGMELDVIYPYLRLFLKDILRLL